MTPSTRSRSRCTRRQASSTSRTWSTTTSRRRRSAPASGARRRGSTDSGSAATTRSRMATSSRSFAEEARGTLATMTATPSILFLCVHNAGRSQMAAAFARRMGAGRVAVLSGGSEPAAALNPAVVAAMAERGIDISAETPRRWADDDVRTADVVVTMGCGDTCPYYPGPRYVDWELEDPAGRPVDAVRAIRDDIERRVAVLVEELVGRPAG